MVWQSLGDSHTHGPQTSAVYRASPAEHNIQLARVVTSVDKLFREENGGKDKVAVPAERTRRRRPATALGGMWHTALVWGGYD